MKRHPELSKPMRWNEIHRAAVILGVISKCSNTNDRAVRNLLKKRIREGKVVQLKHGQPEALYCAVDPFGEKEKSK